MAKGDDAIAKKKNKAIRKRNRRAGADTPEAVEGVKSHKRRRKAGTRRVCEAMCYSLPTREDPFNDKRKSFNKRKDFGAFGDKSAKENVDITFTDSKGVVNGNAGKEESTLGRLETSNVDEKFNEQITPRKRHKFRENGIVERTNGITRHHKTLQTITGPGADKAAGMEANRIEENKQIEVNAFKPLKKVVWKLGIDEALVGVEGHSVNDSNELDLAFQSALRAILEGNSVSTSVGNDPKVSDWQHAQVCKDVGQFQRQWLQACAQGSCVLGVTCDLSTSRAYVVPAGPHVSAQRNTYGSVQKPIALFLVSTKEQALVVRQACKPLKGALDIQSVSLHPGTSLQHQVDGMAMQMPEVIVATPDRLCDLLDVHALSLSSISYVVVDGMDDIISHGFGEQMGIIRKQLQPGAVVGVLSATFPLEVADVTRQWLQDPIVRAVSECSLPSTSACITQAVTVVTTDESKLSKFNKLLERLRKNLEENKISGTVLLLVNHTDQIPAVTGVLDKHGLKSQTAGDLPKISPVSRNRKAAIFIAPFDQSIEASILADVEIIINYDFSWPVEQYIQFLTGMARSTVKGRMETLCSGAAALRAADLIEELRHSWQPVPRPLLLLAKAGSLLHPYRM